MSLNKTLKIEKWAKKRTVRKKVERFKTLVNTYLKNGGLTPEEVRIYGLPKEKVVRLKVKKEKKKIETTESIIT